jgi:hypothetical protein
VLLAFLIQLIRALYDESFHALEFFLEPSGEIVRSVFEKHDKAKGKEHKQNEPKKPANQRHGPDCIVTSPAGQRCPARKQTSD